MVITVSPPSVSEPTLGFLAALAKRRGGSQQPRAISPFAPLRFPPFSILTIRLCRSPVPPSRPKPHRAAIKLPLSFVLLPPLLARPADSTAHTVRKPPRRFPSRASPRHPLSPCGRPPAVPASPRRAKETRDRFEFKLPNTRLPRVKSDTWSSYAWSRLVHGAL